LSSSLASLKHYIMLITSLGGKLETGVTYTPQVPDDLVQGWGEGVVDIKEDTLSV
jgi:hypothetical protein